MDRAHDGETATNGVAMGDDVHVETAAVTLRSVINDRAEQQDAALITSTAVAVADGLGGHPDGAAAARTAVATLGRHLDGPTDTDGLIEAVRAADRAVSALAQTDDWRRPGAALVATAATHDGTGLVGAWTGDTRAWLITDTAVTAVTTDHSHPDGGMFACLGDHGPGSDQVDTFDVPAGHRHRVLLTSDGAHGPLGDNRTPRTETIAALLTAGGVQLLVDTAAAHGHDNATAALIDVDTFVANAVTPPDHQ